MKLSIPFLTTLFVIVFLASCKKKVAEEPCQPVIEQNHSNDTIFPSDYTMAYPGSWWEYNDGFVDSCTSWKAVPFQVKDFSNDCIYVHQDQKIVPTGLFYAEDLAFNQRVTTDGEYSSTIYTPLFDTLVGEFYDETFNGGSGLYAYTDNRTLETLERLDSMTVGANTYYDVLHVREVLDRYYGHTHGGPTYFWNYWFSKNTGLIKWTYQENGSIPQDFELVNHYIAPH